MDDASNGTCARADASSSRMGSNDAATEGANVGSAVDTTERAAVGSVVYSSKYRSRSRHELPLLHFLFL